MNQKQIEMAVDMGEIVRCDSGLVIKYKGAYYIKAPNGHLIGLGTEQYGLNGRNFRVINPYRGVVEANENAGIDSWSDMNCPSDNT